jgi:tRNA A-37 threonylcarbamoyl transferase component Bud32
MTRKPLRVIHSEPVSQWHTEKGIAGYKRTISDVQRSILEGRDLAHNYEQRDFARMARTKRTVRIHLDNGQVLFGRFVSPLEDRILAKVRALGVPTEEISTAKFIGYEIPEDLKDKIQIFKSAGIAIKDMTVISFGKKFWRALDLVKENLPEYLAKLHNAGIRHSHLHLGNIVYDPNTNRISIIDFSAAKDFGEVSTYISDKYGPARIHVHERKWENIDELMKIMGSDYIGIMPTLAFMTEEEFKEFWGRVYDLYDLKYKDEKQRTLFVYKMVYLRSKYGK